LLQPAALGGFGNDSLPDADDLLAELEPAFDPHSIDGRCIPPKI
jgi:hypothetical protein